MAPSATEEMSESESDDSLFDIPFDSAPKPAKKKRRNDIDVSLLKTSDTSLEAAAAEREATEAARLELQEA